MQPTRSVTAFILVGLLTAALAVVGASAAFADGPANRGWTAPVGAADEFADQSD